MTRIVNPAARARIARHHRQRHRLVLASASLDVYAMALGTRLGFDDVVCTRVAGVADELSGSLEHVGAFLELVGITDPRLIPLSQVDQYVV